MKKYHFNLDSTFTFKGYRTEPLAVDRSQKLFFVENQEIFTPIGEITTPKTVAEIFESRSLDLKNKIGSRDIYVLWSGGIDSTAVLVSLLIHFPHSQIKVIMSLESVAEYPEFYTQHILNKLDIFEFSYTRPSTLPSLIDLMKEKVKVGVLVTGELGNVVASPSGKKFLNEMWNIESLNTPIMKFMDANTEKIIALFPYIETLSDYLTWENSTFSYHHRQFRLPRACPDFILEKNMFHMFDCKLWNDYMLYTPVDTKWPGLLPGKDRLPIKQYIFDYDGNYNYLLNKTKVASLHEPRFRSYYIPEEGIARTIDTDWNYSY
jgi:hypothetical protein